jgi:hypothetical protein
LPTTPFETFPAPFHLAPPSLSAGDDFDICHQEERYLMTEPLFAEDPGLIKVDSSRRPITIMSAMDSAGSSSFEQINYGNEEAATVKLMDGLYIERVMERARELSETLERQKRQQNGT